MKTSEIRISGMSCNHCVMHVRKALEQIAGVTVEQVEIGKATVRYDDRVVTQQQLAAAVANAGYAVTEA